MALALSYVVAMGLTFVAVVGVVRTVRRVRIGLFGRPADATVTGCADPGRVTWMQHRWTVDYTMAGGGRRTGVRLPSSPDPAPGNGTQLTVHYDPRHPERIQPVRWEWERIVLTGLIGVPACVAYAVARTAPVVAALTGARWADPVGRGAAHLAESAVPILGLVAAALLMVGTLIAWEPIPRYNFAAALAVFSAAQLAMGGLPVLVVVFPLMIDATGWKVQGADQAG